MDVLAWIRSLLGRSGSKWECADCGTVHRTNPKKCQSCGNTVLVQHRD